MSDRITFDANSNIVQVVILDSASTTGGRKTGLAYNTAGLIIATRAEVEAAPTVYTVTAGNVEDITTLGTYAAPTASKCRFKEIDATNMPGWYEIHFADARFSVANAKKLTISLHGATGMVQFDGTIDLARMNLDSATIVADSVTGAVGSVTGDVGGNVVGSTASVTGAVGSVTGAVGSVTGAVGSVTGAVGSVTGSVGSLADAGASLTTLGDTRMANLDATVSSRSTYAGGAVASVTGAVGSVTGAVGSVADAGASLTALGDTRVANLDATVSSRSTYAGGAVASVTGAVGSVTGAVGSVADAGASLTALGDTRVANLDATVSSRSTYAGGAVASVTGAVGSVASTVSADLVSILGTALTETAGLIAGGFKKFFNVAAPTATALSLPDAVPGAVGGLPTTNGTNITQPPADMATATALAAVKTVVDGLQTAPRGVALAPFVFVMRDTNFIPRTGLTVTGTVSKDGAAFGAITNPITEVGNGSYKIALGISATEMTAAFVDLNFAAPGAIATKILIKTQE